MSTLPSPTAPPDCLRQRRAQVAARLDRPLLLLAGRPPAPNCAANPTPFRAESNYLYCGGPAIEGAALLIEPGSDGAAGCRWFREPAGPDDAVWVGPPADDRALLAAAGLPDSALGNLDDVASALGGRPTAAIQPACHATHVWTRELGVEDASDDERLVLIDLRNIKDEHEVAAMRRAADITVAAHRAVMACARDGILEAEAAAEFHAVLHRHQARASFQPIITVRGEILHCHGYGNTMTNGSLLLVDGGAEEPGGYASDVTRTYPVSGRWSDIQRRLYEIVLQAMNESIQACVPGKRYREVHDLAAAVITAGLVDIGLLKGDPADLAARGAHALFFTHGVGHLIGLDVHDMEDFGDLAGYAAGRSRRPEFGNRFLRLDRDLQPNMAVTIEPGIYFVPAVWANRQLCEPFEDALDRPAIEQLVQQPFGGIRIEETVRVTNAAPEVLTEALPSTPDAVSACIGESAR